MPSKKKMQLAAGLDVGQDQGVAPGQGHEIVIPLGEIIAADPLDAAGEQGQIIQFATRTEEQAKEKSR